MSKVLIDSWSISDSLSPFFSIYSNDILSSDDILLARQNLLSAIVLWDDIYLNMHSSSMIPIALKRFYELFDFPLFIHDIERAHTNSGHSTIRDYIYVYYSLSEKIKAIETHNGSLFDRVTEEFLLRCGFYLAEADSIGAAYLPHPSRAKVLSDSGIFKRKFDAKIYLDIVDKEIREYIEAVNELAQFQLLSTSFPVLYKFISSIAKDPTDEFRVALDLRKDKNVSLFRESVNDINEELKRGNIHALRGSLMKVQEICNEITDSLYKKPLSYGVTIGLSPSIEISQDRKPKVSSSFHTTFLSDLANFALKGDIPVYYYNTN